MTTLITILCSDKNTWGEVSKIISEDFYEKVIVFCCDFCYNNFSFNEKVQKIKFDENLDIESLFIFFSKKIKEFEIKDFEIDLNITSSKGDISSSLINSVIKNGFSFNFVYFKGEVKYFKFFEIMS